VARKRPTWPGHLDANYQRAADGHETEGAAALWRLRYGEIRLTKGSVMAMQQYSRQHVIDLLNCYEYTQLAEEASRELPDPVDVDRISAWLIQHGLAFLAPA
jgi:hypothetical protein